jgi:HEAT repeat protein
LSTPWKLTRCRCASSSDSAPVRRETCHVLSKLAFMGDDKTIVALGKMIGDKDADVKSEAVKAMGVVAGCKNDLTILQVLSEKLQSRDWSERECAANAMLLHADRGNESAVSTVSALLKHQDVYVRSTAVSLLTKLSLPCVCKVASGDQCLCKTIPLLLESTHDELPVIRKAAIEALELVANRKDKRVADRVKREMLSDKDFSVRGAVEHAIGVFLG